jgi:exonuclease V gamma subunit
MEILASRLAQQLQDPAVRPTDPFERQYVVVGSSGMRDWLRQSLVARTTEDALPIATQLEFAYAPGLGSWLIGDGAGAAGGADPWAPNALVWNVMASLRALAADPDLAPLQKYFADARANDPPGREGVVGMAEYDVALQVARLFDRYIRNAPAICRAFDAPGEVPKGLTHADATWQKKVWHHLRHGALKNHPSQPVRLARLYGTGVELPASVPRHISIFGLSQLPAVYYEAIVKLGDRIRFDWYLLTPTGEYVADTRRGELRHRWEQEEPFERSPLLLAFGGAVRGAQRMIIDIQDADIPVVDDQRGGPFEPIAGLHRTDGDGVEQLTILDRVHRGLWRDTFTPLRSPAALGSLANDEAARHQSDPWVPIPLAADLSLRVHACASPVRQVEVMRDMLLDLFAQDPSLQPRDVLVMTPEVARFAPIIQTVFARRGNWVADDGTTTLGEAPDSDGDTAQHQPGNDAVATNALPMVPDDDGDDERVENDGGALEAGGAESAAPATARGKGRGHAGEAGFELPFIPYRIVDRSLRVSNPMAQVLTCLMALGRSRATRLEVLEVLSLDPVLRRLGMTPAQLARWTEWFEQTHVRYGVDGAAREAFGGPSFTDAFSWRHAMDRIALAAAIGDDDAGWGDLVPATGPANEGPSEAGRCLRAVQSVLAAAAQVQQPRSAGQWRTLLFGSGDGASPGLLLQLADGDGTRAWMWRDIHDALAELEQGQPEDPPLLAPEVLERYFEQRFDLPVTIPSIGHNSVTICSLQPSRSVPHKVIFLLGLDDGVFPRGQSPSRWDLTAPATWDGKSSIYYRQPSGKDEGDVLPLTWLDPRDADRTLFLEALLSARQALHIFYTGRHNETGRAVPPASPVSELLRFVDVDDDNADAGSIKKSSIAAGEHPLHIATPLHAFSSEAFDGADGRRRSHDPDGARQAQALRAHRQDASAQSWSWYSAASLNAANSPELQALLKQPWTVEEWVKWIDKPIEQWVKRYLRVSPPRFDEAGDVAMPVSNDGLQTWGVRDQAWRMLVNSLQHGAGAEPASDTLLERLMQTQGLALGSESQLRQEINHVRQVFDATKSSLAHQRLGVVPVGDGGLRVLLPCTAAAGTWEWVTGSGIELKRDAFADDLDKWLKVLLNLCALGASAAEATVRIWSTKDIDKQKGAPVGTMEMPHLDGVAPHQWLRWYGSIAEQSLQSPARGFGVASSRLAMKLHASLPSPTEPRDDVSISHLQAGDPPHPLADPLSLRTRVRVHLGKGDPSGLRTWLRSAGAEWVAAQCANYDVRREVAGAWTGGVNDYKALSEDDFWSWFSADQPWLGGDGTLDREMIIDAVTTWFPLINVLMAMIPKK